MSINHRLEYRISKSKTIKLMVKSVELKVPAVELLQDTFTDILENVKDQKEIDSLKKFIGLKIMDVMLLKGYETVEKMPVKTDGIFNNGTLYRKRKI